MLQSIINFIIGKKTVDGVMTVFNKTLADLQQVHRQHSEEAERKTQEALEAQAAAQAATDEARRAAAVSNRLTALIGDAVDAGSPALQAVA